MQRYLGEECSSRGTSEGLGQKCAWSVPGPVRRPQSSSRSSYVCLGGSSTQACLADHYKNFRFYSE